MMIGGGYWIRFLASSSLLLGVLSCSADAGAPGVVTTAPIALTNVTLIDGRGGQPSTGRTIILKGGRVAAIQGAERPRPRGAVVIDLSGQFVMPGLIDTHVHLQTRRRDPGAMESILKNALLGGVTAVRDMGGNGTELRRLAQASNSAGSNSPKIYYSTLITGPDSEFYMSDAEGGYVSGGSRRGASAWFRRIAKAEDIPSLVAEAKAYGATGLKVHSGVSPDRLRQIGREAKRQGLLMWGHAAVTPSGPDDAVQAGMKVLSHADELAFAALRDVPAVPEMEDYKLLSIAAISAAEADETKVENLLRTMHQRGVILEPTLYIMATFERIANSANRERRATHTRYASHVTQLANRLGVMIVAGTDHIGGSSPNIHAELQLLVRQGGLTPLQAISAGTSNAARAIGIEHSYGTIEVGKVADLVVLRKNPSVDIRNTQTVSSVFLAGRRFDRGGPMPALPFAEPPVP